MTPKKCNAVLFYNLLEDGNGDSLALHAALPVTAGEKWLANFWVRSTSTVFKSKLGNVTALHRSGIPKRANKN